VNKVDVDLDMLGATVMDMVSSHVDGANIVCGQGDRSCCTQQHLAMTCTTARYSASALERETVLWRFEDQDIKLSPRKTQKPEVERHVRTARSVSIGVGSDLVDRASAQVKAGGEGALHIVQMRLISAKCGSHVSCINKQTC
jgi:hypothetical protein